MTVTNGDEPAVAPNVSNDAKVRDVAVVLLGRGSLHGNQLKEELGRISARMTDAYDDYQIVEALLEQGEESLPRALDDCVKAGARRIIAVPAFFPVDPPIVNWLKYVARRWLRESNSAVEITFGESVVESQLVLEAINGSVEDALSQGKPLEAKQRANANNEEHPAWSVIPPHTTHALFCQGPRCTAAGSGDLGGYLRKRLKEEGLNEDTGHVLEAQTGCLFPCNLGPLMVVYPEGTWYCGLDRAAIDRIIDEHFLKGEVVTDYAFKPSPQPQSTERSQNPYT
jgi:(2Fe-2S) ferredoxin